MKIESCGTKIQCQGRRSVKNKPPLGHSTPSPNPDQTWSAHHLGAGSTWRREPLFTGSLADVQDSESLNSPPGRESLPVRYMQGRASEKQKAKEQCLRSQQCTLVLKTLVLWNQAVPALPGLLEKKKLIQHRKKLVAHSFFIQQQEWDI